VKPTFYQENIAPLFQKDVHYSSDSDDEGVGTSEGRDKLAALPTLGGRGQQGLPSVASGSVRNSARSKSSVTFSVPARSPARSTQRKSSIKTVSSLGMSHPVTDARAT